LKIEKEPNLASEPGMIGCREKNFERKFNLCFLIRLVLRTEVLTQEKRMFLLHSLEGFEICCVLVVKHPNVSNNSKRKKYYEAVVFHPTLKTVGTKKNTTR